VLDVERSEFLFIIIIMGIREVVVVNSMRRLPKFVDKCQKVLGYIVWVVGTPIGRACLLPAPQPETVI
jgi:hypothetical protein